MTALLKPSKAQTVQEAAMKRALTVIVLLVLAAGSFLVIPEQVSAGSSTDAALALGAFAVLNQIARGETIFNGSPHVFRQTVVVEQPVVQQPAVVYAPPAPAVVYAPAPPPAVVYAPPPVIYAPAPPPTIYYVPAPTPVYAYPYGYPHYRAPYRW